MTVTVISLKYKQANVVSLFKIIQHLPTPLKGKNRIFYSDPKVPTLVAPLPLFLQYHLLPLCPLIILLNHDDSLVVYQTNQAIPITRSSFSFFSIFAFSQF